MAEDGSPPPAVPLDPVVERALLQAAELARDAFMEAGDPGAYLRARDLAREVGEESLERHAAVPTALALLTAAECTWFAAREGRDGQPDPELVVLAVWDCAHAATAVRNASSDGLLSLWSSVTGSVLEAVGATGVCTPGSEDAHVVTRLVAQLHVLVPADVVFHADWGGPNRVVQLAAAAVAAWRSTGEPVPDWLGARVSASIEAPRRSAATRLGRLLASADADAAAAEVLADTLAGPREELDAEHLFGLLEASTARTLLDGVAGLGAAPLVDPQRRALQQQATAYAPWKDAEPIVRELLLTSTLPLGGTPEAAALSRDLVRRLEEQTALAGDGFRGVASVPSLGDVHAGLEPHQVLVRYVVPTGRAGPGGACHALVVTPDRAGLVPLPVRGVAAAGGMMVIDDKAPLDFSDLPFAVAQARTALAAPASEQGQRERHERLAHLHDLLVAPVLASGLVQDATEWVVVPSRALHGVPWMALHDHAGRWLLDDAAVTLAPSASVWMHLLGRGAHSPGTLVSLGDPLVTHLGHRRLPATRDEVRALDLAWRAARLDSKPLLTLHATWAALAGAAAGAGLVHVGTHGSFPDDAALFGQDFLLSPGPGHDGRVSADALRGLPLGESWCVLLALCSGGAYRVGPGDEPYGLVPALLEAGATTVVAPQWAVDDATAGGLVEELAPLLLDLGPSEALRRAVLARRDASGGHPGDACAFVSIGTGAGPVGISAVSGPGSSG